MAQPIKRFMEAAIKQAKDAWRKGDYAVGAVIVKNNDIIARGSNSVKLNHDPTQHAEIVAIQKAARKLKTRHLVGCILYTTHEPCPMCASAAVWAKMRGIIYGARLKDMIDYRNQKGSDDWSWRTINIPARKIITKGEPKLFLIGEFMREECKNLFHS